MKIIPHTISNNQIAEIISDEMFITTAREGLEFFVDLSYQGYTTLIISQKNITPDFFDLQNGIAGDILQSLSNYRVHLLIIGDFSIYTRQSAIDFIYESNKYQEVNFVSSLEEGLERLGKS